MVVGDHIAIECHRIALSGPDSVRLCAYGQIGGAAPATDAAIEQGDVTMTDGIQCPQQSPCGTTILIVIGEDVGVRRQRQPAKQGRERRFIR